MTRTTASSRTSCTRRSRGRRRSRSSSATSPTPDPVGADAAGSVHAAARRRTATTVTTSPAGIRRSSSANGRAATPATTISRPRPAARTCASMRSSESSSAIASNASCVLRPWSHCPVPQSLGSRRKIRFAAIGSNHRSGVPCPKLPVDTVHTVTRCFQPQLDESQRNVADVVKVIDPSNPGRSHGWFENTEHGRTRARRARGASLGGVAVAAVALVALLALAFAAELLRRRRRAGRVVGRTRPRRSRSPSAPPSSRSSPSSPTLHRRTSRRRHRQRARLARGVEHDHHDGRDCAFDDQRCRLRRRPRRRSRRPPVLAPPVVLEPPVTPKDLEPESPSAAPAPTAPPFSCTCTRAGSTTRGHRGGDRYVVVAGRLPLVDHGTPSRTPARTARSIDAGWRAHLLGEPRRDR